MAGQDVNFIDEVCTYRLVNGPGSALWTRFMHKLETVAVQ